MIEIQEIPIKDLILLERNPRKISKDQMDKLKASIQDDPKFLWCRPILVNQDAIGSPLQVYAGNQRVRAAKALKRKTIPCIVECGLSETIMKERIIKDNVHYGTFDFDILTCDYDIPELISYGFEMHELHLTLGDDESKDTEELSSDDTGSLGVKFNISIPEEDSTSFKNQLDDLLLKFPRAKLKKK